MRLIDADALRSFAEEKMAEGSTLWDKCFSHEWAWTLTAVDKMPTIDPESLRPKGEWIGKQLDNFRMWEAKCSECGWTGIENYDAYIDPFDFNFCPNCGADMRGDTE